MSREGGLVIRLKTIFPRGPKCGAMDKATVDVVRTVVWRQALFMFSY